MLDKQTFEKLCTYDWEKIILDLTLYADNKLKFLKSAKVKLPLAQEPIDYAKDAVSLVFDGTRVWDVSKNPDLVKFLKYSVINSLIYDERSSPDVKKRAKAKIPVKGNDEQEELSISDIIPSPDPTADLILIEQQTLQNIRLAIKDDDDACLILEELLNSRKPREIAVDLGISIEDVRNILKRIRRKATGAFE